MASAIEKKIKIGKAVLFAALVVNGLASYRGVPPDGSIKVLLDSNTGGLCQGVAVLNAFGRYTKRF